MATKLTSFLLLIGGWLIVTTLTNLAPLFAFGVLAVVLVLLVMIVTCPSLVLGVYVSDLHKVVLDVFPALLGHPNMFQSYLAYADWIVCGVSFAALFIYVLKRGVRWRLWLGNVPVMSQLLLAFFIGFGLLFGASSFALLRFGQFIGGNLLLLLMAVVICRNEARLRLIWLIWIIMSSVLALGGLWLLSMGVTWSSGRDLFIDLSNIRLGRVSAIAIIFLVASYRPRTGFIKQVTRFLLLVLFCIGVVTSGSKASLLYLAICLVLFFVFTPSLRRTTRFRTQLVTIGSLVIVIMVVIQLDTRGLYSMQRIVSQEGIESALNSRERVSEHYLTLALDQPIFGNGFDAAYDLGPGLYPHNVSIEFFVQGGLVSLALFLAFVASTLVAGWQTLRLSKDSKEVHPLILATFLSFIFTLAMAHTTSDAVGNRDLWFFAGALIGMRTCYLHRLQFYRQKHEAIRDS